LVIKRVVGGLIVPKLLLLTDDLVDIFVFVLIYKTTLSLSFGRIRLKLNS